MGSTVPAPVRAVGRAHSRPSVGRPAGPGVGISLRRELGNPMVTSGAPLYRDGMTSAELTTRRVPAVVRALWAAPTRRATGNALTALLVAAVGTALLGGLVIITAGAVYSLVHWPVGGWAHAVLYLAEVLAAPVLVLWVIQGLAALQRARLHATLGLELPAGGPPSVSRGRWARGATPLPGGSSGITCWRCSSAEPVAGSWLPAGWLQWARSATWLRATRPPPPVPPPCWPRPGCCSRRPGWPAWWPGPMKQRPGHCSAPATARHWRCGSSRWPAAAPTSSPPPTPSAAGSSATCTTAPSSGSSPWP